MLYSLQSFGCLTYVGTLSVCTYSELCVLCSPTIAYTLLCLNLPIQVLTQSVAAAPLPPLNPSLP